MSEPGFWDRGQAAQSTIDRANELRKVVDLWKELADRLDEVALLHQLAEEEADTSISSEIESELTSLEGDLRDFELRAAFSSDDDRRDALLTIHPGAGGTESADWAEMLLRMYTRWAERKGFKVNPIDIQPGEEAGIKSATIEVMGEYAYGYLKAESGVHRLVRISPFDAQKRRHTSFASVFAYPEVDEDINVEINEDDLEIETFRASGPGGQHVNKTSSAVRIKHIPTGIVVQCQAERSQHKNRAKAMQVLRARLYQHYKEEEEKKRQALENTKKKIEWGNQIRSYVLYPYNLVKDHRTGIETSNTEEVMNGNIDMFIEAYLLHGSSSGG